MKFKFTDHAQYRMHTREISTLHIREIILRPDFSRREENDIIVSIKEIMGKGKIGVVWKKLPKYYLILTIYYADKK